MELQRSINDPIICYSNRFTEEGRGEMSGYEYAYNPCTSFVLNAPLLHPNDCLDDLAVSLCIECTHEWALSKITLSVR